MGKSQRSMHKLLSSAVVSKKITSFCGKTFSKCCNGKNDAEILQLKASFKRIVRRYLKTTLKEIEDRFTSFDMNSADFRRNLIELFEFIDKVAFNNRLSNLQIYCEVKNLGTASGLAAGSYRHPVQTIFLSPIYLNSFDRLCKTLMHEMCHVAQWCLSGDRASGHSAHNEFWKYWVKKCTDKFPHIKITVYHNYQ